MDFFVTGTGTLCFLAYSIASSLPVISHSLQGATMFSLGSKAKKVSSKRTWKERVEFVKEKKSQANSPNAVKCWINLPDHSLFPCIHERQHQLQLLWQHPPWPIFMNMLYQKLTKQTIKRGNKHNLISLKLKFSSKKERNLETKNKLFSETLLDYSSFLATSPLTLKTHLGDNRAGHWGTQQVFSLINCSSSQAREYVVSYKFLL